ncbi:PEGA domain-containing protein [Pseudenhygromyxa sp. WMMC2535]|uniref:PEGA domain-containing protein n=1 Tax=Pseudenhygromyxa sp. WMMC2535 TaxID=2712867 RepID=UPI0020D1A37D|nr:PEGA domain-containing protein [Pseudenhygromyxa sp. WMMC2535]
MTPISISLTTLLAAPPMVRAAAVEARAGVETRASDTALAAEPGAEANAELGREGELGGALVGVQVGEALPKRERESVRESFERSLDEVCEPRPCTAGCGPESRSLGLRVDGESRSYTLHWEARDPALEGPLIVDSSCELCSLVELEAQIASDLGPLCERLARLEAAPGRVQITSDPDGAWVRIDGGRRGSTPWTGELPIGSHELELGARGYKAQSRELSVVGGVEERHHITLLPVAAQRPSWPGWSSLGLGVAMGVAGSVLIALHDKPVAGRCTGLDVDAEGDCRYVYTTRPLGVVLAVLGAGSFATGVGLVVWSQGGEQGGTLSLRGRF